MEKYKTYKFIDKRDVADFSGLENEVLTSIDQGKGPDTPPLAVESFGITYPHPNYRISRNSSNYFVFEYIVSGKGTLILDGVSYPLKGRCAYLLPPGSAHEYFSNRSDPLYKYWINFKSDLFFDIVKAYGIADKPIFNDVDLEEDFKNIFGLEKLSMFNEDIYIQASGIIFSMLMKLARNTHREDGISFTAIQIRDELDKSVSTKVTINDISRKLFISRSKLIREFKKYYGVTPYEYLLQRRLSFAKLLLKNTNQTVKNIAERLEFADDHYFCSFFKEKTGMTPSEYRSSNLRQ